MRDKHLKTRNKRPWAMGSIGDSTVAQKALLGFMRGWAQIDGETAFRYAVENSSDPKIAELLAPVAEQWALSSTSDEVAFLIEQITAIEDGGIVFSHISRSLAQRQPELTMDSISVAANDRARSMSKPDTKVCLWNPTEDETQRSLANSWTKAIR